VFNTTLRYRVRVRCLTPLLDIGLGLGV
jgi:hypothetical protein